MRKIKPRILSGFVELLPKEQLFFNQMIDTIRVVFERFGFTPIETPSLELSEVLLAKGGGETEQQVYRFSKGKNDLVLRFDLTIPLARYVAQHYAELTFPFRRYQIQKVWRAERPQRGRFREFYQCDIDVIGSVNPLVDAEISSVTYAVFKALGFDEFTVRINNRKILNGFLESLRLGDQITEILRAIDKLEKQGEEAVRKELESLGVSKNQIEALMRFTGTKGTPEAILEQLKTSGIHNAVFTKGVEELETVVGAIRMFGVPSSNYGVDLAVARGFDYYTGTVYETRLEDFPEIGSVCSGGRYDNLAGYYTDKNLPGVGISIGLTRLFYKLKDGGLIKPERATPSEVLVTHLNQRFLKRCLEVATILRENGINTEVYFETDRISKQLRYANLLKIPFVCIIGEEEVRQDKVTIKEMTSGKEEIVSITEAIQKITGKRKGG